MADPEKPEQAPEDVPDSAGASIAQKGRRSLSKSRRELTEEELAQSGVRLMLLDEVDRLDREVIRLESFEETYHKADKEVGILQEKRRRDIAIDVMYGISVGIGGGLLTLAPSLSGNQQGSVAAIGVVLIIGGIAVKVRGK